MPRQRRESVKVIDLRRCLAIVSYVLSFHRARPGFIVGFWALVTAAASNTGYVSMRTLAQINDTMAEHSIDAIAKVRQFFSD